MLMDLVLPPVVEFDGHIVGQERVAVASETTRDDVGSIYSN